LLSEYYEEEWQDHKERLERDKEFDIRAYSRPSQIGSAHRIAFIEALRAKEMIAEQARLVEELGESFRGLPLEDLRQIAETRKENARRKSLSKEELSALARQERPTPTADELPQFYTPRGHTQQIELTPEVLRTAGRPNSPLPYWDFKYLNSRYPGQVNERMNGSSQRRYKELPPSVTREQVIAAVANKELARIWLREYGSTNLNNRIFSDLTQA
jgi:hypothetical protein